APPEPPEPLGVLSLHAPKNPMHARQAIVVRMRAFMHGPRGARVQALQIDRDAGTWPRAAGLIREWVVTGLSRWSRSWRNRRRRGCRATPPRSEPRRSRAAPSTGFRSWSRSRTRRGRFG